MNRIVIVLIFCISITNTVSCQITDNNSYSNKNLFAYNTPNNKYNNTNTENYNKINSPTFVKKRNEGIYYLGLSFITMAQRNKFGGSGLNYFVPKPSNELYYAYMGKGSESGVDMYPIKHINMGYAIFADLQEIRDKYYLTYSLGVEWRNANPYTVSNTVEFDTTVAPKGSMNRYSGTTKIHDFFIHFRFAFNYKVKDFDKYGAFYVGVPATVGVGPKQSVNIEILNEFIDYPSPQITKTVYSITMGHSWNLTSGITLSYKVPKAPVVIGTAFDFGLKGALGHNQIKRTKYTLEGQNVTDPLDWTKATIDERDYNNDPHASGEGINSSLYYGWCLYITAWVPVSVNLPTINWSWFNKIFPKSQGGGGGGDD